MITDVEKLTPIDSPTAGHCRFCGAPLQNTLVDLGMSPPCNNILKPEQLNDMEPFYPLHVWVCDRCFLVQLQEYVTPDEIFSDYSYFSSFSDSWLRHAQQYVEMASERFALGSESQVVEIASNDGYLLQYFVQQSIPALGVEPAANVAEVAVEKGIPTVVKFFGRQTARELAAEGKQADLIIGNNVLAHVPDVNDLVAGMKILLKPEGHVTMEFPHLLRLMAENQFDTIYHEHFSYFSLFTVEKIFAAHGLTIFDVDELPTHGGSLRIYARHSEYTAEPVTAGVAELRQRELDAGYDRLETYQSFGEQVKATKRKLLDFMIEARDAGKTIVGYGAPGKGNTLLNYCGIRTDLLDYTVDRSPYKQNHYLPGTHIPVYGPEKIAETKPDYVLILPWNLKDEIMEQMAHVRDWGGHFVVPIPEVQVYD
ncbi:MAG: class I SAM-dependent methyltransferase [Anaerolineae bacterium]|nr:class I SAM-dependent methyltransferase [Anaerolineae bacterium]